MKTNDINQSGLDKIYHVAIQVSDVEESIRLYRERFRLEVEYQDETWSLIRFEKIRLALVTSDQHPAHIGFFHPRADLFEPLQSHRDGKASTYINDPSGNIVEMLCHN